MSRPAGVILAGGQSRRMGGGDKCLLPLSARPLLAHVIDRIGPQVSTLALNANGDPARFAAFGLPVVGDGIAGFAGPLAGVHAAMVWAAAQGHGAVVTVAADTPFFPADLVKRLMDAAEGNPARPVLAATPDANGRLKAHPTFGLWPTALAGDLAAAVEDGVRKVVIWTDRHDAAMASFPVEPFDPFFNINTPDDLITARKLQRGQA